MSTKPVCLTLRPWLKANLGKDCLGCLTGTDNAALNAAVCCIELIAMDSDHNLVLAFGDIVRRMTPTSRRLAYHAIAHVLDWPDRTRIWEEAGLDYMENPGRCIAEGSSQTICRLT